VITALLMFLSACVAPVRARNDIMAQFNPCDYRTYQWRDPEDLTMSKALSDARVRQDIEKEIRKTLADLGLKPAPAEASGDVEVFYSLYGAEMGANRSPQGVIMANDYKMARLVLDLTDTKNLTRLWRTTIAGVVGDVHSQNLSHLRQALHEAFHAYPQCHS
jgi:Domain of unknown function (DUF4136)